MNPGITVSLGSSLHLVPKETTPKECALLKMIDHRFNENKSLDNNKDAKKSCTLLSRSALQVKRCLQAIFLFLAADLKTAVSWTSCCTSWEKL